MTTTAMDKRKAAAAAAVNFEIVRESLSYSTLVFSCYSMCYAGLLTCGFWLFVFLLNDTFIHIYICLLIFINRPKTFSSQTEDI